MITNFNIGGGGTVDAYTKQETDALLQGVKTDQAIVDAAQDTNITALQTKDVQIEGDINSLDSRVTANETAITGKQDELVSGENIKTVNGESLLGEGDIEIQSGGMDEGVEQTIANAIVYVDDKTNNVYTKTEIDNKGYQTSAQVNNLINTATASKVEQADFDSVTKTVVAALNDLNSRIAALENG